MTKIDIVSGFLGAGKTTLIKKLIRQAFTDEKLVIIENEFGQISIDGGFLKESGVQVTEMNSGCICCTLMGDFEKSLREVRQLYSPDRILIEPSGVGKLSDVIQAVQKLECDDLCLNSATAVVDAKKCLVYSKNFGEFFNNQVEHAGCVVLSRTDELSDEKLKPVLEFIHMKNPRANVVTTPWDQLDGKTIVRGMTRGSVLEEHLEDLKEHHAPSGCPTHSSHGHHHPHEHHPCHEHSSHDCGHSHSHSHSCHDEMHHDHECSCGCDHHNSHHADEVFSSWGCQTVRTYRENELQEILTSLNDCERFGHVLRAKGIVRGQEGTWLHFNFVPEEFSVHFGSSEITGLICVIGSNLNESELTTLFA